MATSSFRTHLRPQIVVGVGIILAVAGACTSALAADVAPSKVLPPEAAAPESKPLDFVFGFRLASDYNFRGISQSNGDPSPQAYGELRFLTISSTRALPITGRIFQQSRRPRLISQRGSGPNGGR